ncbi:MAG: SHOCT domain-containing protein [Pseudomonadota bacterium]
MAIYMEDRAERPKSPRKALVLALLLGPIGMFYATVTWASIMLFMNLVFGVITYGLAILILWPIGANIAYNAVCARNREMLQEKHFPPNGVLQIGKAKSLPGMKLISKGISPVDTSKNTILPAQPNKKSALAPMIRPVSVWLYRIVIKKGILGTLRRTRYQESFSTRSHVGVLNSSWGQREDNNDLIESRLTRLKALREKGLIEESEFSQKKRVILEEL